MKWQMTGRGPEFFLSISRGVDDHKRLFGPELYVQVQFMLRAEERRRMRLLWAKKHAVHSSLYASFMCLCMYCPRKRRAVKWSGNFSTNFCAPPARVHRRARGPNGPKCTRRNPLFFVQAAASHVYAAHSLEFDPIGCGGVIPTCPHQDISLPELRHLICMALGSSHPLPCIQLSPWHR